jgi:glycosyltransferase involved in cell wall biosynthesis
VTPVPVSIVVPVRNEAARIAAFVRAHAWAAECIVVDNDSTDDTRAIAEAAGARVLDGTGLTIGAARNVGIAAASEAWVLSLDCDEAAEPELAEELRSVVAAPRHAAYRIRRRNRYLGREQTRGTWGRDWVLRLAPRECRYDVVAVHEQLIAPAPHGDLRAALWHEPYRDLSHHLTKMDQYARWGAETLYAKGRRASVFDLTLRPLWRFFKAYVLTGHCLDGRFGLVTSLLGAQTAFLKYAHLWALERERAPRSAD